jgi:hypothetical protein
LSADTRRRGREGGIEHGIGSAPFMVISQPPCAWQCRPPWPPPAALRMPRNGASEDEAGRGQPCPGSQPGNEFRPCFQVRLIWIAQPIPFIILAYRPTLVCLDACPPSFKPMKTSPLIMPFGITRIMPRAFFQTCKFLTARSTVVYVFL